MPGRSASRAAACRPAGRRAVGAIAQGPGDLTAVVPESTTTVAPGMINSAARRPIARFCGWRSYARAAYGVSKLREIIVTAPP